MRALLLVIAAFQIFAVFGLEPISGTYYISTSEGRWKLSFSRNGTYDLENPRGRTLSGSYNSTDRELALIENGAAGERRHFRYYRFNGQLTLESTNHDTATNTGLLNRMPPNIGSSAVWYDRPIVVQPPVVQPPVWPGQPGPGQPGWGGGRPPVVPPPPIWQGPVARRLNELVDRAERELSNARQALRNNDRREFIESTRRAREALSDAENEAR